MNPRARLILLFALILPFSTDAREKRDTRDYTDHLSVSLAFEESEGGKFVVTVTNITDSNQTVRTETKRFHGLLVGTRPDGSTLELIDPEYLNKILTSFWRDPPNELAPGESLVWEIPIKKLVDKKVTRSSRTHAKREDLEGAHFVADFKRLTIVPKKKGEISSGGNAAQKSNAVTITAEGSQDGTPKPATAKKSETGSDEPDPNQYAAIRWSYFGGKKYAFGLTKDAYKKMATWHLEKKAPSPVAPQEAYRLAKEWIDELEIAEGWEWELDQIALEPIDLEEGKWLWKVSFEYVVIDDGQTGPPIMMHVLITMDGELIQPVVSDHKR